MPESYDMKILDQIQQRATVGALEPVGGEIYEELLSRYEKALFYAGRLQERVRLGRHLADRNDDLRDEVKRLKQLVESADRYVEVLEGALSSLGLKEKTDSESK